MESTGNIWQLVLIYGFQLAVKGLSKVWSDIGQIGVKARSISSTAAAASAAAEDEDDEETGNLNLLN
jgi:hypothetical protein